MSEPHTNDDATLDLAPGRGSTDLRTLFEAAWRQALRGQAPPPIEDYVNAASDQERGQLRHELEELERTYRRKLIEESSMPLSGTLDATLPLSPAEGGSSIPPKPAESLLDDTLDVPPPAEPSRLPHLVDSARPTTVAPHVTRSDLVPTIDSATPTDPQATLDQAGVPAPAPPDPTARLPGWINRGGAEAVDFSLAPQATQEDRPERKIVAGYEVLGELGRGGMGVVYKARQLGLNRVVALKMVLAGAHAGSEQLARFFIEAEAVASLQHGNIVQIYEVGEVDGLPYFSLEFVDGGPLDKKLAGKPQPPKDAAGLLAALTEGIAYAHRQGVIHRDIKPANILLTSDGIPKVTDFGLAKRLETDSGQTKSGTLMGTPNYMAPEQAAGKTKEVGPLSDQYALGAVLYEMLTGRPPLVGTTILETLDLVQNKEPLPPSRLQPGVPRDLETICLKCLQKEPAKRYSSTDALADDLRRYLHDRPIQARPVSRTERAWRWCKRNPRSALLTSLAVLLLLTAGAAFSALAVNNARQKAAEARRRDEDQKAIDQTRELARQRLDQATEIIKTGDARHALELLRWSTPLLETAPELDDIRTEMNTLRSQLEVYGEFKRILDNARFASRFGSRRLKQQSQEDCRDLVRLDTEIRERTGKGSAGLPPLNAEQQQLFQEDVFEAYLIAALVETDLAQNTDAATRKAAAQRAIDWLDQADRILPGTRVVYARRAACWAMVGNAKADKEDVERALKTVPTSAVDHFWHGFAHHLRANEARSKGDSKGAQEFYRQEIAEYAAFLQMRPDHFWGYFNWANCQVELGNLHDALIGFTACLRIRPDFPWPYNNRGTIHLRLGENELALQDYSTALSLNGDYAEASANRGMAYFKVGKPGLALADLDRAVALNPDYPLAYEYRAEVRRGQKQYEPAEADYVRLLDLTADKAPTYLKLASLHNEMGRPGGAVEDCNRALALNPKNAQALYARAGFQVVHKEYLKAREDYTGVLALVPRALEPRRDRANLNLIFLKDFDASLADFKELASLQPNNPDPLYGKGVIHLGRREYLEALLALNKAIGLKPDHAKALWALAQIAAWQGDLKEALSLVNRVAEKLPPDKAETLNVRGDIYRALGRLDEAATDYQRLIDLKPELPETYVSLALVYEKQNKPDLAKQCIDRLVAANPDSARAHLRRAAFRRDHGQFDDALEDCARARTKDAKSVLPGLVEASILAAKGADEEAVGKAEPLLAQAPNGDGQVLYTAACVWGLAARAAASRPDKKQGAELAKRYTERVAVLLQACMDKGFHDLLYPEHNRMAEDPALEAVRRHPQVSALLAHRR
jgi:serine/threonine protein kinase/predicted Zn-dependent protease